jgi:DNA topoisomerase-1
MIVVRVGRWGPYIERGEGERASLPEELPPDELTVEMAVALFEKPSDDRDLGTDPESGEVISVRAGRYGPYVQLGKAAAERADKPKTASLFKSMSIESITLEDAQKLLTLPREVGRDENGEVVNALNGRYGPYIQKGKETRSLETEAQIFTITMDEAKVILAAPKTRGQRAASAEPLRTLGNDPVTGGPITVREGRWGLFVSDGETNQSLLKGDSVESLTTERAAELLARRRERGPSKKKTTRKAAKKAVKKATKSPAKKKTAKRKKASKKGAATKPAD